MKIGTLYGVGVGPGDPELITLKAINILKKVDMVFAASSTKNTYSLAAQIISPYLREEASLVHMKFPMTREKGVLKAAWEKNAREVVEILRDGKDVAFVTIGDTMTYSTFGYILKTIQQGYPGINIKIIPGITSYQAAAAAAAVILAEGEESFTVISGALGAKKPKGVIKHTDNVAMLKVYRNYREIMDVIDELDLMDRSVLVSRCGLNGEQIIRDLKGILDSTPSYLTLLLVSKKK
jgi:precorrin-2/cobalt-factor-2 C20-methyltransferase